MLFQMQKTRLNSNGCHGIGAHGVDVAAEVGVEAVHLLAVVVVLTGRVMNGKESQRHPKSRANGGITRLKEE